MKITILALCALALAAQTFDVASVKRSAAENGSGARSTGAVPRQQDPGRITYPAVKLKGVIALAMGVDQDQISGPQWLDDERYDIVATLPEGKSQADVPVMLQHLLAERFRMVSHEETKPRAGLVLVAAKDGPRLTKSTEASRPGFQTNGGKVTFTKMTLPEFARTLARMSGRPVTDGTGIAGEYDISVNVSMEDLAAGSIASAIQDLGLRLETRTAPAKFIIIDKADKIPTGN